MEISQIAGAGRDPVTRSEEDKKLKNTGAIPPAQPVNKDSDAKQSRPEHQEEQPFEHLRQEPLQLLLRAVGARLMQTFGISSMPPNMAFAIGQVLSPETVSARMLVLFSTAFEHFKIQHADDDAAAALAMFKPLAGEVLQQSSDETREVLSNLHLHDDSTAAVINKAVALAQSALAHFAD